MNKQKNKILKSWIALLPAVFLTVLALSGCFSRPRQDNPDVSASSAAADSQYEVYTKSSIQMQKDFDQLADEIFMEDITESLLNLHFLVTDPAAFGITDYPKTFGEFSLNAINEDMMDMKAVKTKLSNFDINQLKEDQKLTFRILNSYIDTNLQGEKYGLYTQPLAPTIGLQAQLPILLSEYTFYRKQDIDDYLELLNQVDEYFDQILIFEQEKAKNGLLFGDTSIQHIIDSCSTYISDPETSFLKETFETRLDQVSGLTEEEKTAYKEQNMEALKNSFIPAYEHLVQGMEALKSPDNVEGGLCNFPGGKQYYQFLVNSGTHTSYKTIKELRAAIERQMDQDLTAITKLLEENPSLYLQSVTDKFSLTDPNEILEQLQDEIQDDYPALMECNYSVKYVPKALESSLSPAFYFTPAIDQYEDNTIYINNSYTSDDIYTTLAHEGFPGHLYQNVYFFSKQPHPIRHLLSFTSYSEGWATYVEYESYAFDNGLTPELQSLLARNKSSVTALHAMLDININYYDWDKSNVKDYLSMFYTDISDDVVDSMYYTMIENPGNYLDYYVGYLEIINMRKYAEKALDDKFNLKDFHTFLLDIGPAPFDVIRGYLQSWVTTEKMRS